MNETALWAFDLLESAAPIPSASYTIQYSSSSFTIRHDGTLPDVWGSGVWGSGSWGDFLPAPAYEITHRSDTFTIRRR